MGKLKFREVKQLTQGRRASEVLELEVTWTALWATAEAGEGTGCLLDCGLFKGAWKFPCI